MSNKLMEPEVTELVQQRIDRGQEQARIFVTENERLSERYPSFSGYADIDGTRYDVALWRGTKPTREGKPYLSGTMTIATKKGR